MVDSVHRMVTEGLEVAHLRLVIGSSLGCMHSFMWAEMYPELMDGTVGLSCQPVEISGRNWIMRRAAAEAIRHDPDWNNGNYGKNPAHYIYSAAAGPFMPESAARIQELAPTRAAADQLYPA
jgi:homoserine O-acetyltransferase